MGAERAALPIAMIRVAQRFPGLPADWSATASLLDRVSAVNVARPVDQIPVAAVQVDAKSCTHSEQMKAPLPAIAPDDSVVLNKAGRRSSAGERPLNTGEVVGSILPRPPLSSSATEIANSSKLNGNCLRPEIGRAYRSSWATVENHMSLRDKIVALVRAQPGIQSAALYWRIGISRDTLGKRPRKTAHLRGERGIGFSIAAVLSGLPPSTDCA